MKPNVHGDIYRTAFDSAQAELNQILVGFEELRARKERIEKVVLALKPLMGVGQEGGTQNSADLSPDGTQQSEEVPTYQYQATNGNGSSPDPFQQRVDQVLGQGVGSKDPRRFQRQF
jgi:hypothetical protein